MNGIKGRGSDEEINPFGLNYEQVTTVDSEEQDSLSSTTENVADIDSIQKRTSVFEGFAAEEKDIYKRITEVMNKEEQHCAM